MIVNRVEELKTLITKYDTAYRKGSSIVPDSVYDLLVDELIELVGEDDPFFDSSIKEDDETSSSERREPVPIVMASMGKVKTIEALFKWAKLKGIPEDAFVVLSPKYDGCSLAKEEVVDKAWTRGGKNSSGGLRSDEHLKYMNDIKIDAPYTFGEVIISRKNWEKAKESFEGDSARNGVAGLFRRDYASEELQYVDFIRYGVVGKDFKTKQDMFDFLNLTQKVKVPYGVERICDITEDYLQAMYKRFSQDYELDGLIIELNDIETWNKLGRERNGNPKGSVAYKGNFEEVGETLCTAIEYNISKGGNAIPVAILEMIKLDGAKVSRVTLNNASFMKEMGIGVGSRVRVKRSGGVIPLIVEVLNKEEFVEPPYECFWDGVHLKTLHETDEQKKKKILSFFRILDVENVSDKTIELLFNSGYVTIKDILLMKEEDFRLLERFGERKAEIVYECIHSKMKNVSLSKLQHASGIFTSLGSKKLLLLEHFETKPSIEDVLKISGFSDILANNYLNSFDAFWSFIEGFPVTWTRTKKVEAISSDLVGTSFCFTGVRRKDLEGIIESKGGKIASGVSKTLTYLVMKEVGSGSSKEQKALDLGVKILTVEELEEMLLK